MYNVYHSDVHEVELYLFYCRCTYMFNRCLSVPVIYHAVAAELIDILAFLIFYLSVCEVSCLSLRRSLNLVLMGCGFWRMHGV